MRRRWARRCLGAVVAIGLVWGLVNAVGWWWTRAERALAARASAARERDRVFRGLLDRGRFAELEERLAAALRGEGPDAAEARRTLARLLRLQGRFHEVRRLLRDDWAAAEDPSRPLRELWALEDEPIPLVMVQGVLDRASEQAPDDDRVWLGRANLALWSGRLDEADDLLTACLRRRPDDPAVWRARLDWARAAGRPDVAGQAVVRLAPHELEPDEALELEAWFAAQRNDRDAERRALESLVERAPAHVASLERLAILAVEDGDPDRAAGFRRRKDDSDRARELYRKFLAPDVATIELLDVGRIAEALGFWFEARGWWSLVSRFQPGNSEARAALARLGPRLAPQASQTSYERLIEAASTASAAASPRSDATRETVAAAEFVDDAEKAGLGFQYDNGRTPALHLPETMGGGVAVLDYDGDGWLDVYCVQGGAFPPPPASSSAEGGGDRLFRNRGDGTFEDATERSGLSRFPRGYGHGAAVGDYDGDGFPDLFVSRWRSYALYRNLGDGSFADATADAGLGGDRDWPTSAAWADLDGDGDLDLYVCHYLVFDPDHAPECGRGQSGGAAGRAYCDPRKFEATRDRLYRNDGGRFVDVAEEAGIVDRDGRGLGVVAADLDGDGKVDLYVANDTTANYYFRNIGGMKFEEEGVASGTGASSAGGFQAGMGIACGDLDGDDLPDLAVTNFYGESTSLFRNLGGGSFSEDSVRLGLATASRSLLGFGIGFLDYDNDGRLDLAAVNGHVNDFRPDFPYAMPSLLLKGVGKGRLIRVSGDGGPAWTSPRVGRGLAIGDLDNDGKLDLLAVSHDLPLAYLHNRTPGGRFLTLRLEGTASNRDAVGARATVAAGGRRQVLQRIGGGSYLSASDPRLHVGLDQADRVDSIEIEWPSRRVDRYTNLPADRGFLIREGDSEPRPLPGFPPPP